MTEAITLALLASSARARLPREATARGFEILWGRVSAVSASAGQDFGPAWQRSFGEDRFSC